MKNIHAFVIHFFLQALNCQYTLSLESPTIYYQVCTTNTPGDGGKDTKPLECSPDTWASDSKFSFGNVSQNVLNLTGFRMHDILRLKCYAPYPILWLAYSRKPTNVLTLVKNEESNRYDDNPLGNKTWRYTQQVSVQLNLVDSHNTLRCQSFPNPNLAAKVFLKLEATRLGRSTSNGLKVFVVDKTHQDRVQAEATIRVPCVSYYDDNAKTLTLSQLSMNGIHGDLATRNILVFPNNVVKITDFGLSRKLYSCTNYVKKNQAPLPWRWMTVESLRYLEFSTQSDVWSFRVAVWEIFTAAQVPFSGVHYFIEFIDLLESGFRLTKPQRAPQAVYEWMLKCWKNCPNHRATFADSIDFFGKLESSCSDRELSLINTNCDNVETLDYIEI